MSESRQPSRRMEKVCISLALLIWVASIAFGFQTMLRPQRHTPQPENRVKTSMRMHEHRSVYIPSGDSYNDDFRRDRRVEFNWSAPRSHVSAKTESRVPTP